MRLGRRGKRLVFVAVLVGACGVFVNPYLRGDGNGYYAYVRSAVVDHDLRFENEFRRGDPAFLRAITTDGEHLRPGLRSKPGYIRNQWSVGASLLWSPPFLAVHAVAESTGLFSADGYAFPYRWACAFATALYTAAGLFLAWRVARQVTDARAATLGVALGFGALSLAVYALFLPFWGLALATMPAAALMLLYARGPSWRATRWLAFGLLVGLATTTHPLGICWMSLLAVAWFTDEGTARDRLRAGVSSAAGFVIAEVPQMIVRAVAHGNPFDLGYNEQWRFLRPAVLGELFSAKHGLFSWTPVAIVAVAGLVVLWRRETHRRLATGLLVTFGVLLYLGAAYVTDEQSSFGNRMFVHFTPGFVVGIAVVAAVLLERRRSLAFAAAAVLITWNALFMFQWAWGLLPKRGAVDWSQMARQQFTTAPRQIGRVAVMFFTDRDRLIREVQARDEQRLLSDSG